MLLGDDEKQRQARALRLADDCDPTLLHLSPEEGFLLSRVDGVMNWETLRKVGGASIGFVDRTLESWLKDGIIEWVGAGGGEKTPLTQAVPSSDGADTSGSQAQANEEETRARVVPLRGLGALPEVDESLDVPLDIQQQMLEFAAGLDRPYHELLAVPVGADARAIKKAYFGLSKRFHPDRYFRRNTGDFGPLIETCFKKILEAYELLSDPTTRAEVEKQAAQAAQAVEVAQAAEAARQAAAEAAAQAATPAKPRPSSLDMRRRLRRRAGRLGGHQRVINERKRKAKTFFEAGMAAFRADRWLESAGSVRLAMAFDPENEVYREHFVDVQRRAHEERARALIKQADSAMEMRDFADAYEFLDEAVIYRPADAELAHRTANLGFQLQKDLKRAKELATLAVEVEPENPGHHLLLGQVYKAAGLEANARRELEATLRLDPKNDDAKRELRSL
jgi:curved DNA-binding protein CbpA